ncbi:MAG: hypothetical protein OJF60_000030 [Burkholderiaceae bacterium]|nr:MAG: hypothetical protein OJF60_000030 [Burkholderiaceae bacterium]
MPALAGTGSISERSALRQRAYCKCRQGRRQTFNPTQH